MSSPNEYLAEGWCRGVDGALRREVVHSMLRRLSGWDYRQRAIYQLTITLADRASRALGRLEVRVGDKWVEVERAHGAGLKPEAVEARVVASEIGAAVARLWWALPEQWPGVSIIAGQLMPDHFHGVIFVEKPQVKTLGNIVGSFKSKTSSWYNGYLAENNLAARGQEQNGGQEQGGGQARGGARSCARARASEGLWSPGYQDTILFRAGQLANMKRYLADNPRRLAIKRLFPDLFRVVGELKLPLNWGDGRRLVGHFMAIGNRFLLERPLVQVQVSRRDFGYRRETKAGGGQKIVRDAKGVPAVAFSSPAFDEKRDFLLEAAKHGAVLVSPCVSDGEREIARLALAAERPLVTLHNKGFSPLQKPGGRYFDACADGRLLMLAPIAWLYQPGEKPMTRFDATAMNRICQGLVGEDAASINYHGMQPGDIDSLAWAAARMEEMK